MKKKYKINRSLLGSWSGLLSSTIELSYDLLSFAKLSRKRICFRNERPSKRTAESHLFSVRTIGICYAGGGREHRVLDNALCTCHWVLEDIQRSWAPSGEFSWCVIDGCGSHGRLHIVCTRLYCMCVWVWNIESCYYVAINIVITVCNRC